MEQPTRRQRSATTAERLIVALDVSSASEARRIVQAVGESAKLFKVGKQLFTAEGPQVVRDLMASGRKVFLDLKFHDIPNTVGKATQEAARLGVVMLTVHASGGSRMLKAAVEAAAGGPLVLAVTVLTSFTDADLQEIGVGGRAIDQVLRLAQLARTAGCGGVVASAQETRQVRQALGAGFAIVNPGVRPKGADAGDQARVVTPSEAIAAGATHIVVGRPITAAPDPAAAAAAIVAEMDAVEAAPIA
ncbi:MAG TPA: orotidine-5'-phosphate decarboxylase [Terriglobia bacterium]|nr:orotidine-5'-phosphate decarboxylase [Terriglobia bacterium]